jgi:hypothetical protein
MKTKFAQIDLAKTKASWPAGVPFQLAHIQKFKHGEPTDWTVIDGPIVPGVPLSWAQTYHDEYLRIPVFSYMLHRQTDLALATMLQLGLEFAGQLGKPIQELFLVTGVPVELCYEDDQDTYAGLKYYVGFAFR